jgi:hypothetical protein
MSPSVRQRAYSLTIFDGGPETLTQGNEVDSFGPCQLFASQEFSYGGGNTIDGKD